MAKISVCNKDFIIAEGTYPSAFLDELNVNPEEVYITSKGKLVSKEDPVKLNQVYHVHLRILGGKGGFGSMLRAIGAQIEKTTNREACRDLSGRRMRDVNHEKELRDWVAQKAEREREREKRRQERRDKRKQTLEGKQKHFFDDPDYHNQRMKVLDQLEEALQQGLHKGQTSAASATSTSSEAGAAAKRKSDNTIEGPSAKKTCEWLGIDVNLSDLDSDSDTSISEDTSAGEQIPSQSDSPITVTGQEQNKSSQISPTDGAGNSNKNTDIGNNKKRESEEQNLDASKNLKAEEKKTNVNGNDEGEKSVPGLLSTLAQLPLKTDQKVEEGPLNLDQFESIAELEVLGLDRLKNALSSLGLKCGGTLQQRAERLWAIKGKSLDKIDPKLFAKPMKSKKK